VVDTAPVEPRAATPLSFGRVVIVGGGCYGAYYLRQLRRARAREAVMIRELIVVDRDAACAVAADGGRDHTVVIAEWARYLEQLLAVPAAHDDALVPSPLMPHLLLHWLRDRACERAGARAVAVELPDEVAAVRWQRAGTDGSRYVSFADWMCPVNCIEPRVCPHTRAVRDWEMPRTVAAERGVDAVAVLHCRHRTFGVGMIDLYRIQAADATIAQLMADAARTLSPKSVRVLVGTVSNCHGALGVLSVGGSPSERSG
jgi:hypothetical protein